MAGEVDLSRRRFVKAGVAVAAAAGLPVGTRAEETSVEHEEPKEVLPRRALGRTGEKVTMLTLGTGRGAGSRLLNAVYKEGIRYVDTADCYANGKSEKAVGEWMAKSGHRKAFFIVTKDHPKAPDEWVEMVDRRREVLQSDYIDMFFIHGLGGGFQGGGDQSVRDWPKMKEWGAAAGKMKKAGKVRFVGFSTHTAMPLRTALLNNAAAGGWVDAVMVASDPQLVRQDAAFNKALDNCHAAGVGLVCMKGMRSLADVPKFLPEFESMGLTTHQAVLQALWSDGRFSSICSDMHNLRLVRENAEAARQFKPLSEEKVSAVTELYRRYASGYCNGCDGRCQRAAGTEAALGDIARFLSYYEADGSRDLARRLYASLTAEERDCRGADLAAASMACVCGLDFESLMARAQEKLA